MNLNEIEAQGFILALFIRDDGQRFLLGTGAYQFLDSQLHFTANSFANDVVEVQGNDGVYFAGQVRRANTQAFDGYIGDADTPREDIENYRRQFIAFFRKNYYYTVVYVFNNGSAIKRQKGFIVDAPEVKELYQIYPQYHIALNFEDVNYYQYNENDEGIEQFGKSALITLSSNSNTGGLIWQQGSDEPIIYGNTEQNQYSGKNLFNPNSSASASSAYAVPSALPNGIRMTTSSAAVQGAYIWSGFIIGNTADYVGRTLTLSTLMSASSTNAPLAGIGICNSNGSSISGLVSTGDSPGIVSKTFTQTDADNRPKIILLFYTTAGTAAPADSYVDYTNLQLEIGSTATDYEPYVGGVPAPSPDYPQPITNITGDQTIDGYLIQLGSIELCKIGTYQDYIYKDSNDDWYVHKAIGKLTPNGTEDWFSSDINRYDLDVPDAALGSASNNPIISTHFISRFALIDNSIFLSGVGHRLSIYDNNFGNDLTSFKNWLGSNTVDVYYALDTSTDTKITDNTLIGQLNDWASSLTTTGGVEWDNVGAVWEIGGSGGPVNVTIDSIDNVYPIWEVTGPATNPEIEIIESNTSIQYTGSIGADEKLVVDMLNKTALVNGVSMIGNISGVWCYLKPGNNKVTYTTDNAGAMPSKLLWQEVVG